MCGIAGIISCKNNIDAGIIKSMTELIKYRGPDDYGYLGYNTASKQILSFKDENNINGNFNLFFGHRRLSIIDLTPSGHQPMSYLNGRYYITYNGEIYNYIEIKEELVKDGYKFKSSSDTEVIMAAYDKWGIDCLGKFNGMWAFAILDVYKNILFCSRDRLGIKPFYYHFEDNYLSFASEIKQLVSLPWVRAVLSETELYNFLVFFDNGSNSHKTFFKNIYELRGGNYFIFDFNKYELSTNPQITEYWDINLSNKTILKNNDEYAEKYLDLLTDSVKIRLRSDVEVGSCLSGGLDSSGIVCIVTDLLKRSKDEAKLKTFTSFFNVPEFDEREYALEIINSKNVEPFFVTPFSENLLSEMDDLVWHLDEPFQSSSMYASRCIFKLFKNNNTIVSLDGQGPDEMLGGYFPFTYHRLLNENITSLKFLDFIKNLYGMNKFSYAHRKIIIGKLIKELSGNFFSIPNIFKNSSRRARKIFCCEFLENYRTDFINNINNEKLINMNITEGINYLLYEETKSSTLPCILKHADRNSMTYSVEARLPFLDYRLVEYTFSIPIEQKIRKGITKYIYRNAMNGILPEKIRNRKTKLGFDTPEENWIKTSLKDEFYNTFSNIGKDSPVNKTYILNEFEKFINNKIPFSAIFWRIYSFEKWRKLFKLSFD